MLRTLILSAALVAVASPAFAQAIGGPEKGRPVQGDPGISSMVVMDRPDFRVLRDWAEPATLLATRAPVLVCPAMHTFKNTGTVTATIVEVFGKAAKPPQ